MGTYHIKCDNPSVKAEDIEPKVFDIVKKVLAHRDMVNGRLDALVKANIYHNNADVRQELDKLNELLNGNLTKQSKINDAYMDNLIGIEIYKDKVSLLREEEKQIKAEIGKCKIRLVEKEQSEAYLRTLKLAIDNFDETKKKIDIVEKKETVKLIFKSVEINGSAIASVRLYPPFQQMYEEVLKECNTLKNQEIATKTQTDREVCILQPTVAK